MYDNSFGSDNILNMHRRQQEQAGMLNKTDKTNKAEDAPPVFRNVEVTSLNISEIEITSILGQEVYKGKITGDGYTLTGVNAGVYLLKITTADKKVTYESVFHKGGKDATTKITFITFKQSADLKEQSEKALAPEPEDRLQKIERICKRFNLIVAKFGLRSSLESMIDPVDIDSAERLLTKIEPWVLFGQGYPTSLLWGGLRYDAWDGNHRLVLIDASGNADHMHAFDMTGKGLRFTHFRSEQADNNMKAFKDATQNTNAQVPTLITPQSHGETAPGEMKANAQPAVKSAIAPANKPSDSARPHLNNAQKVIYEPEPMNTTNLDSLGIDVSKLEMTYEEAAAGLEAMTGCRYRVVYNGVFMGHFEMQRIDGNMRITGEVDEFKNAYAGKNPIFLNQITTGKLWKFAVDADEDTFGDPDFLTMLLQGGFPDSHYHGLTSSMLISGAMLDVAGGVPGMAVGMVNLVRMMKAEARGNSAMKNPKPEKQAEGNVKETLKEENSVSKVAQKTSSVTAIYNGKNVPVYRGGNSFKLRSYDYRLDKETGFVETTHGLSVNVNPTSESMTKFGGAYKIESLPDGLKIIQRGEKPGHYEIVPAGQITPE
ncbi:MAG: T9SS type A sorting domain-containing protein, partial [Bacteroidota bacterium]|nr:T9SS type A sorting domain-containing protein [Bacteroidota bacterium]